MMMRAECELNSAKAGELPLDARVRILEARDIPDGSRRVKVEALSHAVLAGLGLAAAGTAGSESPTAQPAPLVGWLTAVTKAGVHNLHAPVSEVIAPKPIVVRTLLDVKSDKVDTLSAGALVHVLESTN